MATNLNIPKMKKIKRNIIGLLFISFHFLSQLPLYNHDDSSLLLPQLDSIPFSCKKVIIIANFLQYVITIKNVKRREKYVKIL